MCNLSRNIRLLFLCGGLILFTLHGVSAQAPVRFIENKNQWPSHIDFVSPVPGGKLAVSAGKLQYVFVDGAKLNDENLTAEIPAHSVVVLALEK